MTPLGSRVIGKLLIQMRASQSNVNFKDLVKVCVFSFGEPRQSGTSHMVFATPWHGDPRVNIQENHGKAKVYRVRQVLNAIDRLAEQS